MAFETYLPARGSGRDTGVSRPKRVPAIRLSKNSLVINKWAREFFRAANIELAYDRETNTIRIGPGGTMRLNNSKVYAKGFYKAFGISSVGLFPVEVENGHLFARLS
ncbi:MAG: hypothetical protein M0Z41_04495 [Peptococcaceae bacterium]|jgi:hypothetical protein|nr:hypothetical protein [Peptococcaceae bacterium]